MSTDTTNAVQFGPLELVVSNAGEDRGDSFDSGSRRPIRKLTAIWSLVIDGEAIIDAPFYFGTPDDPTEATAADVFQSVMSDLQSVEPYIGYGEGELDEWAQWADDLGYFAGETDAKAIRKSIAGYQTIRGWRALIVDRTDEATLTAVLKVAQECEQDCPMVRGEELTDAGSVGIDTARAERDPFNGQRWEDDAGNVYSAADILAARLDA